MKDLSVKIKTWYFSVVARNFKKKIEKSFFSSLFLILLESKRNCLLYETNLKELALYQNTQIHLNEDYCCTKRYDTFFCSIVFLFVFDWHSEKREMLRHKKAGEEFKMSRSTNNNKQFDVLVAVVVVVGLALVRSYLSEETWWTEAILKSRRGRGKS